jgi:dipeptidase E
MRLYLSSMIYGNHPERLVALAGHGSHVAVVMNALDNVPDERAHFLAVSKRDLEQLGFVANELDLRDYVDAPGRLAQALESTGLIWVNGGNTFLLRHAMVRSGFDEVLRALLDIDQLVYGGFSAGVCAITPSLRGIEYLDEPLEPAWDGAAIIDYYVAVHFRTGAHEPIQQTVQYYRKNNLPYVALRDGEVLIVDADRTELVR